MKAEDLYHTGIVVEDVDATMRWLTDTSGYRWCEKFVGEQEVELADGIRTVPLHFAYSITEPRLEVLAAQPGTVWEVTASGLHHLGFWSDDVEEDVAELEAHGHTVDVRGRDPFGTLLWAYCTGPVGPRIELVTRSLEPLLSELFTSGRVDVPWD